MKYWMLEKGDVVGPFEPAEIKKAQGFTLETLVCPETLVDNPAHWKPASFYLDLLPTATGEKVTEIKSGLTGNTNPKLKNGDNISIEEYFSNIYQNENSGLSEILGIPDELENSDMYLGRFLQRELRADDKTKNTKIRRMELELEKERRKNEKSFGAPGKILSRDIAPRTDKDKEDFTEIIRPITERGPAARPPAPAQKTPEPEDVTDGLALASAQTLRIKSDEGVKKTAEEVVLKQDSPEEIFKTNVSAPVPVEEPLKTVEHNPETDPGITFNVKRTQLKAQDINAPAAVKKAGSKKALAAVTAVFVFLFLSSMIFIYKKYQTDAPQPDQDFSAPPVTEPAPQDASLLSPPGSPEPAAPAMEPAAPAVLPPLPVSVKARPDAAADKAVLIAKNYFLKNKNATVGNFLDAYFEQYRRQGYAAVWSSEPLHKDIYIVKYRLTKTRQEPIVYIFEVDTAKETISGALNNLTLDLLGL